MEHAYKRFYETAIEFVNSGVYEMALMVWDLAEEQESVTPMTWYYRGWCELLSGNRHAALKSLNKGEESCPDCCFPNRLEAILALRAAIEENPQDAMANYYLGILYYDKRQYRLATELWMQTARLRPGFPTVWRNLALAMYNKYGQAESANTFMEKAFSLDRSDSRVLMELDSLHKKLHAPHEDRLHSFWRI